MRLHDYGRILRHNWLLLLIGGVLTAGLALTYSLLQPPTYQSISKVFVSTNQASSVTDLSQGATFTQQIVKSYADVATAPIVLNPVIKQLHIAESADSLARSITAQAPSDTAVIQIAVTDRSPARAASIANAISKSLGSVVSDLTPAGAGSPNVKISVIQPAIASVQPIAPRTALNTVLALFVGIVIALALAFLREALDVRIRSDRDLKQITDAPLLGVIAYEASARDRPLIVQAAPTSPRAEAFRSLRTNLQFVAIESERRTIVVSSPLPGDGKSTTAANLALAIAGTQESVLIVDADLRRPKLADYLGIEGTLGLTDVLVGRVGVEDAIQTWNSSALHVLPAGSSPPNPNELLQSQRMSDLMAQLGQRYSVVIYDAPPLLPVSDAALLARRADGVLMVCAARRTTTGQLKATLDALEKVDVAVLGVVLTMVPVRGASAYGYGSSAYGYGSSNDQYAAGDSGSSAVALSRDERPLGTRA